MEIVVLSIVGAAIVIVIAGAVFSYMRENKRREAFRRLAQELGLKYVFRDDFVALRYGFLHALQQGENRYGLNVLRGCYEGHRVAVFDYHYATNPSGSKVSRETRHYCFSFFVLEHDKWFPDLRIYPEGILSKLAEMLGHEHIEFESIEFAKAFCVRSQDRKFAYDICHPRMMEYLLAHRDLSIEIDGDCVALGFAKRLKPEEIPGRLRQLIEIRDLFPEYLFRD